MTVTYLYRPDNKRLFVVVDYHKWRDTSATTAGFAPNKVVFVGKRAATSFEEKCYSQSWRMLSYSYTSWAACRLALRYADHYAENYKDTHMPVKLRAMLEEKMMQISLALG